MTRLRHIPDRVRKVQFRAELFNRLHLLCFFSISCHYTLVAKVIMSTATPPSKIRLPPPPSSADFSDNAMTDSPSNDGGRSPSFFTSVPGPRRSARQSFATLRTRRGSRGTMIVHDDVDDVKLPSLVPGIRPAYSTPLPGLPMVVLSIVSPPEIGRF